MPKGYVVVLILIAIAWTASLCPADDTLVGYWDFKEGQGVDVGDSSDMGNDGVIKGDAGWKAGKVGTAIELSRDGASYVEMPDSDSLDIEEQITISAWIKPSDIYLGDDWKLGNCIVSKRQAYYLCISQEGTIHAYLYNVQPQAWLVGTIDITKDMNKWIHVALVYDGKEEKIYVNGKLDISEAKTGTITVNDRPLTIGWVDYERYFDGLIDEVQVWSRALTEEELGRSQPVEPESKLATCWGSLKK